MSPTRPRNPVACPLTAVADLVGVPAPASTVHVTGVSLASQRVVPGDLYAALPGARVHGASYAADAVGRGAVAVLTDRAGRDAVEASRLEVPLLVVERPRDLLGRVAARVYGDPAESLRLVAVTGTQGKTTTTRLLEGALSTEGMPAAVVGTVGTRIAGRDVSSALTTPEAPDLHGLFAVMREDGVETCAMEVSSHALVLGRVDGVVFDVAGFTNLGRDHLDFHADVEEYFDAKASLFTPERARRAVVTVDDPYGRRLRDEARIPTVGFSTSGADAEWRAERIELGAAGSTFEAVGPAGRWPVRVPLAGGFNVANALLALALATESGLDPDRVARGLSATTGVPGRLEPVDAGQDFTAVVDYAHKPDAVEAALAALRPVTSGRLIVVIGAGGDRDRGKRPVMGEIASRLADVVIVTDDNARTEDPASIRAALVEGARTGAADVREIGDRRAAIAEAVATARPGDTVLVAGKGHETGQEVDGVVHPFDDRTVLAEELRAAGGGRA